MHRLRSRRRIAHALAGTRTVHDWLAREWTWLRRDVRDLKAELRHYGRRAVERIRDPAPFIADDRLLAQMEDLNRRDDDLRARVR